jgi:hypothetical protein
MRMGFQIFYQVKIEINKAIKTVAIADFDYISRGAAPPNPAELLMHRRFGEILVGQARIMILLY